MILIVQISILGLSFSSDDEIIHFNINLGVDVIHLIDEIHHINEIHIFDVIHHRDEILRMKCNTLMKPIILLRF